MYLQGRETRGMEEIVQGSLQSALGKDRRWGKGGFEVVWGGTSTGKWKDKGIKGLVACQKIAS